MSQELAASSYQSEQSEIPVPALYGADADQRIPFSKEFDGELYEVAYVLGAQTDEALSEYERLLDSRLVSIDVKDAGERGAIAQQDRRLEAAIWLFDDRALSAEGFGEEGEEQPKNWKEFIDDRDKQGVIDEAYLAVAVVPLPPAKPGRRLSWGYRSKQSTSVVRLRALFGGRELILSHERTQQASPGQLAEFDAIRKQAALVGGTKLGKGELLILPKFARLAALYDQLGYRATGYKGRVPRHHKAKVVSEDLASDQEAISKK
jgi:hypothetical protein